MSDAGRFTEVAPDQVVYGLPEKSSILTARRRVVLPAQQQTLGSAGAGAGGLNCNFLIADGGLLDLESVVINYNQQVLAAGDCVCDDGSPFMQIDIAVGGQTIESISSAPKYANAEMRLKGSKTYYQTLGSFTGFQLLNPDLIPDVPTSAAAQTIGAWGWVAQNVASLNARLERASAAVFDSRAGMQVSTPLSLLTGFFKTKKYLPLSLVGDLAIQLTAGMPSDVLFTASSQTANQDYSLSNIELHYDIVVPSQEYLNMMVAQAQGEGLVIPFESVAVQVGQAIAVSSSAVVENQLQVQRATNNLLSAAVVQIPSANAISSIGYPSQSCFSHAGVCGINFSCGSLNFPNQMARGDAAIYTMSTGHLKDSCITRALWGNSTNPATQGTAAVFETTQAATGGSVKFAYADSFIPAYDFRTTPAEEGEEIANGVSLAGASGGTLRVNVRSAPQTSYTPFVITSALRYIVAREGRVSIAG